jgi:predicted kinase
MAGKRCPVPRTGYDRLRAPPREVSFQPPVPVTTPPTLVIISGPIAAGKTMLAHGLARALGCPAICRDEIKEGMVHAASGFVPSPSDELTKRTFPVFFEVLGVLLRAGVTTVADAAFQDANWRAGLTPLLGLAQLRIVHCCVPADVALSRALQRSESNPVRRAHFDPAPDWDAEDFARRRAAFERISLEAPALEVDTTDGYRPGLDAITDFVNTAH